MGHGQYLVLVHILLVVPLIHLYFNAHPIQVTTKLISPIVILSEILFLFTVHHYQVKYNQFIFIMSFEIALYQTIVNVKQTLMLDLLVAMTQVKGLFKFVLEEFGILSVVGTALTID